MNFEFHTVGRIIVQRGGLSRLGELLLPLGRRVLLVCGGPGLGERAGAVLKDAGIEHVLRAQKGEPTVAGVQEALALAREQGVEVIVGIGGGSAIDCAKATAAILANGGEPLDYMEVVGLGRKILKPSLPWVAIPTTAGAGAEATRNAVVACPEKQFKASIRSELMLPRFALLDAELAVGVPRAVTAASGADALCQLIESYTSGNANPISDGLAMEGILRAGKSLRQAYDHPEDLDARENMAIAALLSGITLTNAGLGAVHGFAAPIGGRYKAPHGVICAALLRHVIGANVRALRSRRPGSPVLGKYAAIGSALTGLGYPTEAAAIDDGMAVIGELTQYMQIPRLRSFGIEAGEVPQIVEQAKRASSMRSNPILLEDQELSEALLAAL